MAVVALYGGQYGDEGKGGVCHALSHYFDVFVRLNGGSNAGNTVVLEDGTKIKFRMLPSGILQAGAIAVLAKGVCLDLEVLKEELEIVREYNKYFTLLVSDKIKVVEDIDKTIDQTQIKSIGSTGKGIGPCNIRHLERKHVNNEYGLRLVGKLTNAKVMDTDEYLNRLVDGYGINVLIQYAHGAGLDLNSRSHPFVTTSYCTPYSSGVQCGLHPKKIDYEVMIIKPYVTRVGEGEMVSEIEDEVASEIRELAKEYGTVTGRARRIGWFDEDELAYQIMTQRPTHLAITMLDVLDDFEGDFYTWRNGERKLLAEGGTITGKQFIEYVQKTFEIPVAIISYGPGEKMVNPDFTVKLVGE